MPEAPEVAVAAGQLDHLARGRTLESLTVTHPRTTRAQPAATLQRAVGRDVAGVHRHGKWIVMDLGEELSLGIHLRMSGQLLSRVPGQVPDDRHVHAVFGFDSGRLIWFRDPRTFGEIRLLTAGLDIGPDLFDERVTAESLRAHAERRRVGVKAVLLDQRGAVAGIGSYLADEALHRAAISPLAPSKELAISAWERILTSAREIAEESAAVGGVTLADEGWVDIDGRFGRYAPELRVHGRAECGSCSAPTIRAQVGGRSASWCPRCQVARRRR